MTREELIGICDDASVPQSAWGNRDSADAQRQIGECRALLLAGCHYRVDKLEPDVIWLSIDFEGFQYHESGEGCEETETFYLPTRERLSERAGKDWY